MAQFKYVDLLSLRKNVGKLESEKIYKISEMFLFYSTLDGYDGCDEACDICYSELKSRGYEVKIASTLNDIGLKRLRNSIADTWSAYLRKDIDDEGLRFSLISHAGESAALLDVGINDAYTIALQELVNLSNMNRM